MVAVIPGATAAPTAGGAPVAATYWVSTGDATLTNEVNLGGLTTGIIKHTVAAGVSTPATAVEGTDYYGPGGTDIAITDGGTGASSASAARTNLGVAIGSDVQAYNAGLADIASLAKTDGNIIVGDGANWVVESGATARTSLGAQEDLSGATITTATVATNDKVLIQDTDDSDNLKTVTAQSIADLAGGGTGGAPADATFIVQTSNGTLTNEQVLGSLATGIVKNTTTTGVLSIAVEGTDYYGPAGTDIPVTDGGTGASDAATARTNLGVAIGSDVQAYDATLNSIASLGTAADKMIYTTGVDTWAEADITSLARDVLDDATQATMAGTILSGASLTSATVAAADKILGQDANDSDNLKTFTASSISALAPNGALRSVQVFTSTGTWTKPAGITKVIVWVIGAGGGGGGAAAAGATQSAAGGGGGGGGVAMELIDVTGTSSETVTVGVGGAGGTAGDNNGSAGGTSSFGSFCSATGGSPGVGGTVVSSVAVAADSGGGGLGSGGNLNAAGEAGSTGINTPATFSAASGGGGSSFIGGGAPSVVTSAGGATGGNYGGGGSGGTSINTGGAQAGGAGADGLVMVWEYA